MRKILYTLYCVVGLVSYSFAHNQNRLVRCATENIDKAKADRIERHINKYGDFIMNNLFGTQPYFKREIKVYYFIDQDFNDKITDEALRLQIDEINQGFKYDDSTFRVDVHFIIEKIERLKFKNKNLYYDSAFIEENRVGGKGDLNVFVTELGGLLGFARFPWDYQQNSKEDAVVIDYRSLPGGEHKQYNLGRTLTHEIGHWVGLYHTFQDSCSRLGDRVDDTPPQQSPTYGCPKQPAAGCDKKTPVAIENYMNYTDDVCMDRFSRGQFERMVKSLILFR